MARKPKAPVNNNDRGSGTELTTAAFTNIAANLAFTSVQGGSTDERGAVTLTASGAVAAGTKLCDLTFVDGAFPQTPVASATRSGAAITNETGSVRTNVTTTVLSLYLTTALANTDVLTIAWRVDQV